MQNILIIVFLALSIVTYGCSDSTRAQNAPTNKEILIDNKISEVNSLIDSLRTELSSIKRSLEKQQSTIDKQKEEIKKIIPADEAGIYCFRYVRNLQSDKHIHAFRR